MSIRSIRPLQLLAGLVLAQGVAGATAYEILPPIPGASCLGVFDFTVGDHAGKLIYGPNGLAVSGFIDRPSTQIPFRAVEGISGQDIAQVEPWPSESGAARFLVLRRDGTFHSIGIQPDAAGNAFTAAIAQIGRLPSGLQSSLPSWVRVTAGREILAYSYLEDTVFSSLDGNTWQADQADSLQSPVQAVFDAQGDAYLIDAYHGLHKRAQGGSRWEKVYQGSYDEWPHSLSVDSNGVILMSTGFIIMDAAMTEGTMRLSSDGGRTWIPDTVGLPIDLVERVGVDAQGRAIAVSAGAVYRKDASARWTRIDAPLSGLLALNRRDRPDYAGFASGGTWSLACRLGLFLSADSGRTWKEAVEGIQTEIPRSVASLDAGSLWAATETGLFKRGGAGSPAWMRASYAATDVTVDRRGDLRSGFHESRDGGTTWQEDSGADLPITLPTTMGFFSIPSTTFANDSGDVYALRITGQVASVCFKPKREGWRLDSLAFHRNENPFVLNYTFGFDGRGNAYLAKYDAIDLGMVWMKNGPTGSWSPDTAGLGTARVSRFVASASGGMLALVSGQLMQKDGAGWRPASTPAFPAGGIADLDNSPGAGLLLVHGDGRMFTSKEEAWTPTDIPGDKILSATPFDWGAIALGERHAYVLTSPAIAVRPGKVLVSRAYRGPRLSGGLAWIPDRRGGFRIVDLRGRASGGIPPR